MSPHTQGPWTVENNSIYGNAGMIRPFIASVEDDHGDEETNANARLIASAPELLDVCRCALADLEGVLPEYDPEREHPAWETLQELRVAIAKATGEQS